MRPGKLPFAMIRTTTMWASALSLTAISVALIWTLYRGSLQIRPTEPPKAAEARSSTLAPAAAAHSGGFRNSEAFVQKRAAQPSSGTRQPTPSGGSRVDRSVIGIPFPVSPSVEASCKLTGKIDLCERPHSALAKMTQEPRDEAWAAKTEALIQDEVVSERPAIYTIRNIECRSSICAVEIESPPDAYIAPTYNFLKSNDLVYGIPM